MYFNYKKMNKEIKILMVDENHPILTEKLNKYFVVKHDYTSTKEEIENQMEEYDGLIIRSRFPIDKKFLAKSKKLKFIGRVGAGLENIDLEEASNRGVKCYNSPEGNRDAVAEHCVGLMLAIVNHFKRSNQQIVKGKWIREGNRGDEIKGKTIAFIGYGNMGKATAKRLSGFGCEMIAYDIKEGVGDEFAKQVEMQEVFDKADILSFHIPQTDLTIGLLNKDYIDKFSKPFYFFNTARGKSVVTKDLVVALKSGKIKGAGLDVLEFEKASFESLSINDLPSDLEYLLYAENVIVTPHIAGWTKESKVKLAEFIADKIIADFA